MSFSPQPAEISAIRDITEISSKAEITDRIAQNFDDADWTSTQNDITEWSAIKNKFYESKDIPLAYAKKRLAITNRVRVRLGYDQIDEKGQSTSASDTFFIPSCTISKKPTW